MYRKVLVVEDNEAVARLYSAVLDNAAIAGTAADAITLAQSGKYDLVLMDVSLPDSDGATAAVELRERGYAGPIVLVTGGMRPHDSEAARRAEVAEIVIKPVLPTELREIVDRYIHPTGKVPC
jgi:two-component system response regulator BasR